MQSHRMADAQQAHRSLITIINIYFLFDLFDLVFTFVLEDIYVQLAKHSALRLSPVNT